MFPPPQRNPQWPFVFLAVVCLAGFFYWLDTRHDGYAAGGFGAGVSSSNTAEAPVSPSGLTQFAAVQESDPPAPDSINCTAVQSNDYGSSAAVAVANGHLLVVDFFASGQPLSVAILTAGNWTPLPGFGIGSMWDYPACPADAVQSQASVHATAVGSTLVDASAGFVRSER